MLDNVQIAKMESALEDLFEIARDSSINILHNYKWRELLQIGSLNDIGINAKAVPGVEGADFTTTKYPIGELKSARILRTKNGFLKYWSGTNKQKQGFAYWPNKSNKILS